MRTLLGILLLCSAAFAAGADGVLEFETLTPSKRREFPFLRVAVGADQPLPLRGRSMPAAFTAAAGDLRVVAGWAPEGGTPVEDGVATGLPLDGGSVRNVAFVRGDPGRGEPEWSVIVVDVLAGRIGPTGVLFFDHDADGTFLTPGRDFAVAEATGEVIAIAPVVVVGKQAYRLVVDEAAGTAKSAPEPGFAERETFPRWKEVAEGVAHLNGIRAGLDLPPVALDRDASRAAMLHLRYCEKVGGNTHLEDPANPAYTKEGATAGISSLGSRGGGTVSAAIDGNLGSLLHRMELIDPRVTAVGIAADGDRVWIHTECGEKRPWPKQGPVVFPGPGGRWITGVYTGDNPDPRPEPVAAGLPVTVAWYGEGDGVRAVRATLRGPRGSVPCWKNDADGRELATNHAPLRVALLPKGTLPSAMLVLTWEQDGKPCRLERSFVIGRR